MMGVSTDIFGDGAQVACVGSMQETYRQELIHRRRLHGQAFCRLVLDDEVACGTSAWREHGSSVYVGSDNAVLKRM